MFRRGPTWLFQGHDWLMVRNLANITLVLPKEHFILLRPEMTNRSWQILCRQPGGNSKHAPVVQSADQKLNRY